MKISARQALEAFQESFVKQTSEPIAELISDDFVFISSKNETQTKDEMLEWVASFEGRIGDFVTLYENDEVLVGTHSVSAYGEESESKVMFFATVKGMARFLRGRSIVPSNNQNQDLSILLITTGLAVYAVLSLSESKENAFL